MGIVEWNGTGADGEGGSLAYSVPMGDGEVMGTASLSVLQIDGLWFSHLS